MGSGSPSKRQADYYLATAVMAIIYLVRTGLMNCTYPLEESILMDFVPSDQRARWKALDSIASFGWCGSAALGGYLADQPSIGYTGTFLYTAAIQGVAVLLQASLMLIVPLHEKKEARPESADAAEGVAPSAGAVEPLLAAAQVVKDLISGKALQRQRDPDPKRRRRPIITMQNQAHAAKHLLSRMNRLPSLPFNNTTHIFLWKNNNLHNFFCHV
jgi:MFS family permease